MTGIPSSTKGQGGDWFCWINPNPADCTAKRRRLSKTFVAVNDGVLSSVSTRRAGEGYIGDRRWENEEAKKGVSGQGYLVSMRLRDTLRKESGVLSTKLG